MGGLTYGVIEAGAVGFADARVVIALTLAVVAAVVFVLAQRRGVHPMVPPDLFGSRPVVLSVVIGFAFMVGYYGLPFVFSLYLQQARGLSSLGTALVFLPMMLAGLVLTPFSARLGELFGRRTLIVTGLAVMAVGLVVLAVLPATTPLWALGLIMVFVGVGGQLVMPPTMAVLLDHAPRRRAGTASAPFNTSRQIGGALAVAVFGALLADPATFQAGVQTSLLIAAGVTALTTAAALLLRVPRIPTQDSVFEENLHDRVDHRRTRPRRARRGVADHHRPPGRIATPMGTDLGRARRRRTDRAVLPRPGRRLVPPRHRWCSRTHPRG
jgi:predicted MFS family arabinose efflux permease